MPKVAGLLYYPVKGCGAVSAAAATVTSAGLTHDRSFMVVSEEGVFMTQRRHPRLALIAPDVSADGLTLTLRADERHGAVRVPVDTTGPRRDVDLFGSPYRGIDQGAAAARWLSDFLGVRSRLVRVPPEHDRVTAGRTPGTSGYADSCALHIVSASSLDHLNGRLQARGARPLAMNRFRPNIVVDGWPGPHTEDRALRIRVGDAELGYAKLAIRCAVTMVDQETAARAGPEPMRTLALYRRAAEGGVAFGSKYAVLRPGKVSLGDAVDVTRWGTSELHGPTVRS